MPLTKKQIEQARYRGDGKSWDIRHDGVIPSFGVRVYPSGRKTFILRYRTRAGRLRFITIGRVGVLTLKEARDRAREMLVAVADGGDPVAERQAARASVTVRAFVAEYLERHAKQHKKSWKEDERRLERYVVPAIGQRTLSDVTRGDVAQIHAKVGRQGHYEANRVLALASVLFTKAVEWGYLRDGAPNPAKGIQPFRERKRDRWVKPGEMPALLGAIDAEPNVYIRGLFWLYLLTGCRKSELLPRRWDEVDRDRRELRLPDTKDGEPYVVPLSTAAWTVLEQVPREEGNPHIFCGHKAGTHLVNVGAAWRRCREMAGCADVRLHDLRRTVGSWLASNGASLELIGAVLNHADIETTRIYARLADEAPRRALEEHGARIVAVARGAPADREP